MGLPAALVNAGIVGLRFREANEFQKALTPFPWFYIQRSKKSQPETWPTRLTLTAQKRCNIHTRTGR
jgi:hypothetical protein